jgi:L1 cell adhesion molecule like protein
MSITRTKFEELNKDLFLSTIEPVEKSLSNAKMGKEQIDDIVLIGGSTQIPMVQKQLQVFFNGKELNKSITPNETVAYGAAYRAGNLDGVGKSEKVRGLSGKNGTPMSVGTGSVTAVETLTEKKNNIVINTYNRRNAMVIVKNAEHYRAGDEKQKSGKCCIQ